MLIRSANNGDIESIQLLMDELNAFRSKIFSDNTKEFHERVVENEKLDSQALSKDLFFVACTEDSKEIVGFIQGSKHKRKRNNPLTYIN